MSAAKRSRLNRVRDEVSAALSAIASAFVSALVWFLLMTAVGAGLLASGVYLLAGLGWSLIAGGVLCIFAAMFIHRGM